MHITTFLKKTEDSSKPDLFKHHRTKREFQAGDEAPLAHLNVRRFPDWYKPYLVNYFGHGWLVIYLVGMFIGYLTFVREIKWMKGRSSRKVFESKMPTLGEMAGKSWAAKRIEAGDPLITKYLEKKKRTFHHH